MTDKVLKIFICLLLIRTAVANENCELAKHYFTESLNYQANRNIKMADHYFDLGFSLHQLLKQECASQQYTQVINKLITQFTVNQRALCSSGARNDCVIDANRDDN